MFTYHPMYNHYTGMGGLDEIISLLFELKKCDFLFMFSN